jgi:hypothetical protein
VSKSYRAAPEWGRSTRKPQHAPTIEEGLEDMSNPEEIYIVISEWKPNDSAYELEEFVAHHRTEAGAIATLHSIAEGQGCDPRDIGDDTEFHIENPNPRTEYNSWYIATGILGD